MKLCLLFLMFVSSAAYADYSSEIRSTDLQFELRGELRGGSAGGSSPKISAEVVEQRSIWFCQSDTGIVQRNQKTCGYFTKLDLMAGEMLDRWFYLDFNTKYYGDRVQCLMNNLTFFVPNSSGSETPVELNYGAHWETGSWHDAGCIIPFDINAIFKNFRLTTTDLTMRYIANSEDGNKSSGSLSFSFYSPLREKIAESVLDFSTRKCGSIQESEICHQ